MGPTFGRGHFPSLGRPTPFYFLLLLTTSYYLSLPPTYLYRYIQRSALRWKGILSILCLTAALSASAQRTYTLDECLRLGAENNLTLRNSQLDAEAAKETARETFTRYFPTVQAGGMNLRLNRDSYEAGTVPLTDLLDAQTQLRLARDRYTEACTAYCNARTAYRQAVGE